MSNAEAQQRLSSGSMGTNCQQAADDGIQGVQVDRNIFRLIDMDINEFGVDKVSVLKDRTTRQTHSPWLGSPNLLPPNAHYYRCPSPVAATLCRVLEGGIMKLEYN